jgi:1-aminocyclopropane-1-carboxylate deaminase/D-cysteine desulfhydrase-like pyridoxal-dependent ACC family enzyme
MGTAQTNRLPMLSPLCHSLGLHVLGVLRHGFKRADGSISQNDLIKQCSRRVRKENDLREVQCHHSTRQSQSAALMWHRYLESSS